MVVGGIDPGYGGGIAVVENDICQSIVMPTMGDGNDKVIDCRALYDFLTVCRPSFVVIEEVTADRKWAKGACFRFGRGFGCILGALQVGCIPYTTVRPQVWKKAMNLSPDKELSRRRAIEMFPRAADQFARKSVDHGRAEAALLAEYWATSGIFRSAE